MYIDTLVSTTRLKPVRARNEITTAGYITETLLSILLLEARSKKIGSAAASSESGFMRQAAIFKVPQVPQVL